MLEKITPYFHSSVHYGTGAQSNKSWRAGWVIPAIQEAEIRRTVVPCQPGGRG
jgi:hypothetical protein